MSRAEDPCPDCGHPWYLHDLLEGCEWHKFDCRCDSHHGEQEGPCCTCLEYPSDNETREAINRYWFQKTLADLESQNPKSKSLMEKLGRLARVLKGKV